MSRHQREVVRVNPHDAELGVVGVVPGNVLQDLQELVAICGPTFQQKDVTVSYRHTMASRLGFGHGWGFLTRTPTDLFNLLTCI